MILSLLFVAYELRQANRIALVNSVADVYDKFTGINEIGMTDPSFAELLQTEHESLEELSRADRFRLHHWRLYLFNTWITANIAYDNGILAEATYLGVLNDIKNVARKSDPAGREQWRMILDDYPALNELEIYQKLKSELE